MYQCPIGLRFLRDLERHVESLGYRRSGLAGAQRVRRRGKRRFLHVLGRSSFVLVKGLLVVSISAVFGLFLHVVAWC